MVKSSRTPYQTGRFSNLPHFKRLQVLGNPIPALGKSIQVLPKLIALAARKTLTKNLPCVYIYNKYLDIQIHLCYNGDNTKAGKGLTMYCHYHHCPKYRCATCGRRCGANGHAGCGNAEQINDLPAVFLPLGVWFIHTMVGFIVRPLCWFVGLDWVCNAWGPLGWVLVVATILLVVAVKVDDWTDKTKHKQEGETLDPIHDAHLDIINKEYNNGK